MSYVKKIWKDYPDSTTALNAAGLNDWDTRISNEFTNVNNSIDEIVSGTNAWIDFDANGYLTLYTKED